MKASTILLRCIFGIAIGSCLGIAAIAFGHTKQGIGIAIIGGCFGLILALSNILYESSAAESFARGLLLFFRITADKLVPIASKDTPSKYKQNADPVLLNKRIYLGMKVGVAITIIPAIIIAFHDVEYSHRFFSTLQDVIKRGTLAIAIMAVTGCGFGSTISALTSPGIHRRNILLGTIIGIAIGAGLATAINVPEAKSPIWFTYIFGCTVFGWLGMTYGTFSGDNFSRQS